MPDSELVRRLDRLSRIMPQIIKYMQRVPIRPARTASLSLPQLRMLLILDLEGDSTMGEMARRGGVTMPTATSSVNALVKGLYATRQRAAHDRRVVVVSLTPKGRKAIASLHKQRRQRLRAILSDLEPDDQVELVEAFETVLRLVRKIDQAEAGGTGESHTSATTP